jgi:hypothetical protein
MPKTLIRDDCTECGMRVGNAAAYHPYLFCVLYKAGVRDPAAMLASYGWVREPAMASAPSDMPAAGE